MAEWLAPQDSAVSHWRWSRLLRPVSGEYLAKGAFADERIDLVALQPALATAHDVVVVVVVIAVVQDLLLLLGARVLGWRLLGPPLLLRIVHLPRQPGRQSLE